MRPRMWAAVVVAAGLVHLAASCAAAADPDPGDCEPVTEASAAAVADRLGLDPDQAAWLGARAAAGGLRDPAELDGLPGLGPELREALEGAFCWGSTTEGAVQAAVESRPGRTRSEIRARAARESRSGGGGVEAEGRFRREPGVDALARGGLAAAGPGWRVAAGTLRRRWGLGLLLATPGSEPRGDAPVSPAGAGWRTSLAADEETVRGIAVSGSRRGWTASLAGLRGEVAGPDGAHAPGPWQAATVDRSWSGGRSRAGVAVVRGGGASAVAGAAGGRIGPGDWGFEWAHGGSGEAQGGFWRFSEGALRLRAGMTRIGRGYAVPAVRAWRKGAEGDRSEVRLEGRWRGGPGRFLRVGWAEGRSLDRGGDPRRDGLRLVEVGERPGRGVRLSGLWRERAALAGGRPEEEADRETLLRAELAVRAAPWRLRVRVESRTAAGGRTRLASLRVGRRDALAWELRTGLVADTGGGPGAWWYRRRAGGLYGWSRPGPGTWIGGWTRLDWGPVTVEISADAEASGWRGAAGIGWAPG